MESTNMQPINLLPVEVLARIFVLVCTMRRCPWLTPYITYRPASMNEPIILSHVCSYWRRVAIASCSLWTHVDLDPNQFRDEQLPPRTETYIARAGGTLLDIHAIIPLYDPRPTIAAQESFIQFLASISPRAWSMTVIVSDEGSTAAFCHRTVFIILENCVASTLLQLSIELVGNSLLLNPWVLPEQLETTVDVLGLPITALRLHGFSPRWTSKIYHGLTELRLTSSRGTISELAFRNILTLSPKLRILEFDMFMVDLTAVYDPVTPVVLADLEVFISKNRHSTGQIHPIRMIRPGPKLFTLSIGVLLLKAILNYNLSPHGNKAILLFFTGSNINRLAIFGLGNYIDLVDLLALVPTVRVLALHAPYITRVKRNESVLPPASILDTIYITNLSHPLITFPAIKQITRRHSARQLILWNKSDKGTTPDMFSTVCPQITNISHNDPDPTEQWM